MNKQRKVLITITYNELGIIVDTKTEELGSPAQPERTKTHSCDCEHTETNTQWIPVAERLPEEHKDILVTVKDLDEPWIAAVNYAKGTWWDAVFDRALNPLEVLAWMPLPEPYKGGQNEN